MADGGSPKSFFERRLKLAPNETKIDFLSMRRPAAMGSSIAIVISFIALLVLGLNFGIDFRGGTLVQARMATAADIGAIRSAMNELELGEVGVQEFGVPTDVLIRVETQGDGEAQQAAIDAVTAQLFARFEGVTVQRTEVVGPKVSGELIQSGVLAVLLAVLAVLAYIWLRFEWQFAVGAVVALVHDVVLTIGVFSLLQLEFNLAIIAALLTIVGYSLNDTVVVFDRVRENLRRYKATPIEQTLNLSINDTLSRTLMTSVTTLLALNALYFLGGEVIRGFTFAMIWGVIIGTYSSVFVASPILFWLGARITTGDDEPGKSSGAGVRFGSADEK